MTQRSSSRSAIALVEKNPMGVLVAACIGTAAARAQPCTTLAAGANLPINDLPSPLSHSSPLSPIGSAEAAVVSAADRKRSFTQYALEDESIFGGGGGGAVTASTAAVATADDDICTPLGSSQCDVSTTATAATAACQPIRVFAADFFDDADSAAAAATSQPHGVDDDAATECLMDEALRKPLTLPRERFTRSARDAQRFSDAVWRFYVHEVSSMFGAHEHQARVRHFHLPNGSEHATLTIDRRAPLLCALEARCTADGLCGRDVLFITDFSEFESLPRWHLTQRAAHMPPALLSIEVCVVDARQWSDRTLRFLSERRLDAPHYWIMTFLDYCLPLAAAATGRARRAIDDPYDYDDEDERRVRIEVMHIVYRMLGVRELPTGGVWWKPRPRRQKQQQQQQQQQQQEETSGGGGGVIAK